MTLSLSTAASTEDTQGEQQVVDTQALATPEADKPKAAVEPVRGTPEYDLKMVNMSRESRGEAPLTELPKAEGDKAPPVAAKPEADKPTGDLILGKFKSQADLEKAYTELQKKLGGGKTEDKPATEQTPPVAATALKDEQLAAATAEFAEKGELSEATVKQFTDAGIPKAFVDAYQDMARQTTAANKIIHEQTAQEVLATVGGQEGWTKLQSWANTSLSEGERNAFNNAVAAGKESAMLAVAGLNARYSQSKGTQPQRQLGGSPAGAGDRYTTKFEFFEAMNKPEWKTSETYRNAVTAKYERSFQG